ncbi:MAG: DUF3794 domain-containing protein [Lachnospiraceae bacterium]|nr:DUF3794 domain-containing protein [Lachnospiraceae bacterium]
MELERSYRNLTRRKGKAVSQTTLEEDLNVPDQKPDIFRIVHRQGEFRPDETRIEAGKVKVRGIFLYRILYIGENHDRTAEVLEGSIPVDETVFLNELEEGDLLDFTWCVEDLHASAIHSRKANLKCVLEFSAEGFREQPVPLVQQPEEQQDLYCKTEMVHLQQEIIHKKDTLRVREDLNLPPGKPNIRRIIWKEARLQGTELRQEEGRLSVKGELNVFFLYESDQNDGRIQRMEQSIPFRNEVECEECHAELFGCGNVSLQRSDMELQPDYDGEPRMVRIDAVLELALRYFEDRDCEILSDAYSLSREVIPKLQTCVWEFVSRTSDSRARVSGRMKLEETDPKLLQVLASGTELHADYTEQNEQGLLIQGMLELWVLYAAEDDSQPLACAARSFPFEHTVELPDAGISEEAQIRLGIDQLTVSMLDAKELEMKAAIQVQTLLSCPKELCLVEDLEEGPLDAERIRKLPGMVIHIVQPGESLWEIAKSHAAACHDVAELNGLGDGEPEPGSKLLLVKGMTGMVS